MSTKASTDEHVAKYYRSVIYLLAGVDYNETLIMREILFSGKFQQTAESKNEIALAEVLTIKSLLRVQLTRFDCAKLICCVSMKNSKARDLKTS